MVMDIDDEVMVERLWDDGAPTNVTTLTLKKGLATYTLIPDTAHANSTLNLVVRIINEVLEKTILVMYYLICKQVLCFASPSLGANTYLILIDFFKSVAFKFITIK